MMDGLASGEVLGNSVEIQALMARIPVLARARRTTLITGPTGSGKEVVASRLHRAAHEAPAPYIAVHCGALPEQLAEAELFGHTRGAFTGALCARTGLIRSAAGGTLFLDEIDSLQPTVQAKLLRFLESGELRAVGSDRVVHAKVWVIAATNGDLRELVLKGAFREDLMYRLDVMHLDLPPLRIRGGDIELLARHFLAESAGPALDFTPQAIAALYAHDWPGNVRELKHRVERAALLAEPPHLDAKDLGLEPAPATRRAAAAAPGRMERELWSLIEQDGLSLGEAVAYCERKLIEAALSAEMDNRTRAAQRLGIHVRTIFKKLQR
jgi:two-component system response regulator AtoC